MNDITQMLDTAFDHVDQEGMMPEEFEHYCKLLINVPYIRTFGAPDQGQMLDV